MLFDQKTTQSELIYKMWQTYWELNHVIKRTNNLY